MKGSTAMIGIRSMVNRYITRIPLLWSYLISVVAARRRNKDKIQATQLCRRSKGIVRAVAMVISDALANNANPDERLMINRIESLRTKLESSQTELTWVSYGAGSADSHLSDEEMFAGRNEVMTIGHFCRRASQPPFWSLLLFKLIRQLKPSVCLELGTAIGISASYQAAALKLNSLGRLVTLEGSESLGNVAKQNFEILGLDNVSVVIGRFQDNLANVLKEYEPIDFVFIDGHHDEKATLSYFGQIYPSLSKRAAVIFDDIAWSEGMKKAWAAIEADSRVGTSINLGRHGICRIDSKNGATQHLRLPLE
jgi:predicted O-methyltransferase YrrM